MRSILRFRVVALSSCWLCYLSPARAQQVAFPEKNAIIEWNEYRDLAKSLQVAINGRHVISDAGASKQRTGTYENILKQNRTCTLSGGLQEASHDTPEQDVLYIANTKYTAAIVSPRRTGDWVLVSYRITSDSRFDPKAAPLHDEAFETVSPHLHYAGIHLSKLFTLPTFVITSKRTFATGSKSSVEIGFQYAAETLDKNGKIARLNAYEGTMILEKQGMWYISRINDTRIHSIRGKWQDTMKSLYTYEVDLHPSGFPLIKSFVHQASTAYEGGRNTTGTISFKYDITVNDRVPDEEFDLTHFGLPEPMEIQRQYPRRKPAYWYFFGGAVLFALVFAARYGVRRWRLAARST